MTGHRGETVDFRAFDFGQVAKVEVAVDEGGDRLWIVATTKSGGLVYAKADRFWFDGDAFHWTLGGPDSGSQDGAK